MAPEQIERLRKTLIAWPTNWQDEGDTKDAIRALLAEWEERGREISHPGLKAILALTGEVERLEADITWQEDRAITSTRRPPPISESSAVSGPRAV